MADNFHVFLKSRPGVAGEPNNENFGYEACDFPTDDLKPGEVLIRNCYISTDPAQRCQMNEETGVDYIQPWPLDGTVIGLHGVGVIEKSNHPNYQPQDIIHGHFGWPWKLFFSLNVEDQNKFSKVDKSLVAGRPQILLSLLGLVGLTSILGIREKGHVIQGANQTCVVSGAAGACGSLAGQIARLEGCTRVVGICGSDEKCSWLTKDLEFDAVINYKTDDVGNRLKDVCPDGIHVYFDNVGGELSNTVIKQMVPNSHIVLCGQIAIYNKDLPYPPPIPQDVQDCLIQNKITRERFLVLNYADKFEESIKQLAHWYFTGQLKVRETLEEGLENCGKAFVSMMKGGNIGKQLVHVSDP